LSISSKGQVDGTPDAELGKRTPTTWWWAFQYLADEHRFLAELKQRLEAFALELHPDKTRIIEFGRCALEKPPAPRSGQG
jgi:hypothetical protein